MRTISFGGLAIVAAGGAGGSARRRTLPEDPAAGDRARFLCFCWQVSKSSTSAFAVAGSHLTALGYAISFGLAHLIGLGLHASGLVKSPLLIGIALSATSLGIAIPVLNDVGQVDTPFGQLVGAGASIAEIGTIVLVSLFFSGKPAASVRSWFCSGYSGCSCSRSA